MAREVCLCDMHPVLALLGTIYIFVILEQVPLQLVGARPLDGRVFF